MIVERVGPDEWRRFRFVRLRALEDAPDAFVATLAEEAQLPDEAWRRRLAGKDAVTFIASIAGVDVGLAVGGPYDDAAGLYAMWAAPEARGKGVGDRLTAAVVDWAEAAGFPRVMLDVGDRNRAAVNLYARNGFEPTGVKSALPPPRAHIVEHQRARACRPAS